MRYRRKLQSNRGFSLTEMLATVLIVSLVTAAAVSGVSVVRNVYEKVTVQANAQVLLSTVLTTVVDDLRHAAHVEEVTDPDGYTGTWWVLDNTKRSCRMYYRNSDSNIEIMTLGQDSASLPIVTELTKTDGLYPRLAVADGAEGNAHNGVTYDAEDNLFQVTVEIVKDDHVYASQTVTIQPLND